MGQRKKCPALSQWGRWRHDDDVQDVIQITVWKRHGGTKSIHRASMCGLHGGGRAEQKMVRNNIWESQLHLRLTALLQLFWELNFEPGTCTAGMVGFFPQVSRASAWVHSDYKAIQSHTRSIRCNFTCCWSPEPFCEKKMYANLNPRFKGRLDYYEKWEVISVSGPTGMFDPHVCFAPFRSGCFMIFIIWKSFVAMAASPCAALPPGATRIATSKTPLVAVTRVTAQ